MAHQPITRRDFLRHLLRGAAAGALLLGAGALVARPRREAPCTGDGLCDDCAALAGCTRPGAFAAREARHGR